MYIYKDDMFCEMEHESIPHMPENPRLATAYVPFQDAKCIYSAAKGLSQGTIFPDLVMPYSSACHRSQSNTNCAAECECSCEENHKKEGCK